MALHIKTHFSGIELELNPNQNGISTVAYLYIRILRHEARLLSIKVVCCRDAYLWQHTEHISPNPSPTRTHTISCFVLQTQHAEQLQFVPDSEQLQFVPDSNVVIFQPGFLLKKQRRRWHSGLLQLRSTEQPPDSSVLDFRVPPHLCSGSDVNIMSRNETYSLL